MCRQVATWMGCMPPTRFWTLCLATDAPLTLAPMIPLTISTFTKFKLTKKHSWTAVDIKPEERERQSRNLWKFYKWSTEYVGQMYKNLIFVQKEYRVEWISERIVVVICNLFSSLFRLIIGLSVKEMRLVYYWPTTSKWRTIHKLLI